MSNEEEVSIEPTVELGFDVKDRRHIPTIKINLAPCGPDDMHAWDNRDRLGAQVRRMLDAAPVPPQADAQPVTFDLDAAARKLAACMDYPWEYMPEQGRASMREHAKAIVSAALSASAEPTNKEGE